MSLLPRIALGKKGGVNALEISRTGSNVLTCPPEEMLFSSLIDVGTFIETGSVNVSNGSSVFVPFDYGGVPHVTFQVVTGGYAVFPAMYANFGLVYAAITSSGVTFYNNTGAARTVNYQITNRPS